MSLSDRFFRPFETLIDPLDLPLEPLPDTGPVALILHFAKLFKGVLIAVTFLSLAMSGINLLLVWGLAFVVDSIAELGPQGFIDRYFSALIFFVLLLLAATPALFFLQRAFLSQTVEVCLPAAMRWQGHKAVERQDLAFFHDTFAGQVAARIGQATAAVQRELVLFADFVPQFTMQLVGSSLLLAALAWPLALPVLLWIGGHTLLAVHAVPVYAKLSANVARANSSAMGAMTDLYGNIQTVKLFAAEDSEAGMIRGALQEAIRTQHREQRTFIVTDVCMLVMNLLLIVGILAIGLWGLTAGFVSIGDFVAATAIVRTLSISSRAFIRLGQAVARALGTITDAMPVMTTLPMIRDRPDALPLRVSKGEIVFDRASFAYTPGKPVIVDLSLTIKPGERVGLVGLSGAGKSTLVALLLRLYEIETGAIRIDGHDIRAVTQASLREQIGVITQDISLLHRSVHDNILYGKPEADAEEVLEAAKLAHADGFVGELEDSEGRVGLDAYVGDRGIRLSGGQRQRVAIARVLLKNAPILVLDEATAALDSEAEAAIQDNLALLMEGRTVLCIAHRLSTIAQLDRIAVLDQGRIVEQGRPDDLRQQNGLFAQLWERQIGGYIPES